jgi:hypothetical protein
MAQGVINLAVLELRARIQHLEGASARMKQVLPVGIPETDR